MTTYQAGTFLVSIHGDLKPFRIHLSHREVGQGILILDIKLESSQASLPPKFSLKWVFPDIDIQATWHPRIARARSIYPNWMQGPASRSTLGAPVISLHNLKNQNRITFACSDALRGIQMKGGLIEETSEFECETTFFVDAEPPISEYVAQIRIDTRAIPYWKCLHDVQEWWAAQEGYSPSPVPELARLPMYSTWYSLHQHVEAEKVLEQCRLAKPLGCDSVIVDDGWQTLDSNRGYAFSGDWKPERIPQMRKFVDDLHDIGMKCLIWYSVPLVGKNTEAYKKFSKKFLSFNEEWAAGILDPRFPDVREHILRILIDALREWDLDGFKLDFVDTMIPNEETAKQVGNGRDYDSVAEAADRLMCDIMSELRKIKPGIMIEFRQGYIGPLMRKYGNIFRVADCPNDSITNRIGMVDVRLLAGNTAVHSDMIMWNFREPANVAALQFLNILFSVPQISVDLKTIPADHREMLAFWLKFWREHQKTLLDGELEAFQPEALYSMVSSSRQNEKIIAMYADQVLRLAGEQPDSLYIVNATHGSEVVIDLREALGSRKLCVRDCLGREVKCELKTSLAVGLHRIAVPSAGLIELEISRNT